jgi:DNA-binding beta-propeller fold protein YncE
VSPSLPVYVVDPFWPRPLPNDWILGQCAGIHVDDDDHIWVANRPGSSTERELGAIQDPPYGDCCYPAPPVIEFDAAGNVLNAWGGDDGDQRWPKREHGMYIDAEGFVWTGGVADQDHVIFKSTKAGKRVLEIGVWGQTKGSNDTTTLGGAADIAVDPDANEVYIADGYVNRRVIVFDASTGAYKRHWGAYGEPPSDEHQPDFDPDAPRSRNFRRPMHAVRIGNDGLVYTADRANNRIQVFRKDGTFVKEGLVAPRARFMGSASDIDFSRDPEQTFMFVPDSTNMKVWIMTRADLKVVGSFGHGGRQAGQFEAVHNVAVDSKGNIYTAEVNTGKRVQKFVLQNP